MDDSFFTRRQLKVFGQDLLEAFVKSGFDILEEPYIDHDLCGFRATYIRRYQLQRSTAYYDGILTTIVHVVGLPFGRHSQKMVILSAPRNINNEPVSETLKLRVHFDENGFSHVVQANEQRPSPPFTDKQSSTITNDNIIFAPYQDDELSSSKNQSNQQPSSSSVEKSRHDPNTGGPRINFLEQFAIDLERYVSHIIETISPGLIQLPTEMKLEILKKLNLDSIIKMSQVNNEFRSIIFQHGESLWRHLCMRDFNTRIINRMVHKSWMELYRDSYIIHQIGICRKERALPGLPERPALPPAPYRLQIGWLPEVLELPFYPMNEVAYDENNQLQLALELLPLRRVNSSDSLS